MNKQIHRVVFNRARGQRMVVAEHARATAAAPGGSAPFAFGARLRLLCLTGVAAAALVPPAAQAACSVASGAAVAGSNIVCSGTSTGQYNIGAANVTLTNTGLFTATGALLGVLYVNQTTGSGVSVVNQGQVTWTNAQYGGGGTGTRPALNVGYVTGNNWTSGSFLNDTGGSITVDVSTTLANGRSLSAAGVFAGQGAASVTNRGAITVTSSSPNGSSNIEGIAGAGRSVSMNNSGSISVTASAGARVDGVGVLGSFLTGTGTIDNSGSVVVSTTNNSEALAAWMSGVTAAATNLLVNNSGRLEVNGGTATAPISGRAAVYLHGVAGSTPFVVNNTATGVIQADAASYGIILDTASTLVRPVQISNAGSIIGAIRTQAGNDSYVQTGGSLVGDLNLGDGTNTVTVSDGSVSGTITTGSGDDTISFSGGALNGSVLAGAGTNIVNLSGAVNLANALQIDGGAGATTVNIEGIDVKGFTGTNNIANGTNFTNIGTINLRTGAGLSLSGDLFEAAATGRTLNIASGAVLNAAGGTGLYAVHGDVNNSGSISLQSATAGNQLTIAGNYTGVAGSTLRINTVLGDDSSLTDRLVVNGNTSGTTALRVNNTGGLGARTVNGIQVVQVQGDSAPGAFTLAAPVAAGAYEYSLKQGSALSTKD
ncbi:MAG: hypothetical protein DI563_21825 [Variovorax paradoxus]|uniref:Autotransporter outer membrane beta-barrel domain-containing protein n=1 Tax=Variovorax paradoxus TaxID=34073 RepID=A0A2W5PMX1_VARPD|nr:MAG: hypothetical protein DI563_21825 [Variovorax paradoxus]